MRMPVPPVMPPQTVDLLEIVFGKSGLREACEHRITTGDTGNGRHLKLYAYDENGWKGFIAKAHPPLSQRLSKLFSDQVWNDPKTPTFSVNVPPGGKGFVVTMSGLDTKRQRMVFRTPTPDLLELARETIDTLNFNWVLETSHNPPEPGFPPSALQLRRS